jgi:hypothetical protein
LGGKARKIFLWSPPSQLQETFVRVVSMDREDQLPWRPWKRRGDEEWQGDRPLEDRDFKAKRQQGMRAVASQGGARKTRWKERGSGSGSQHN